jgi:DNA-binding CsgD family transcriptional regulator
MVDGIASLRKPDIAPLCNEHEDVRRVARAIAVLDVASTPGLIASLLDEDEATVLAAIDQLRRAGLVEQAQFRSSAFGRSVLRDIPFETLKILHHRAAGILHDCGERSVVVADHLVHAGCARFVWASAALCAAADEALTNDDIDRAIRYLELAHRVSRRARQRADITSQLVRIEWQVNPSAATRSFARMRAAVRAGLVNCAALPAFVRYQLWHGHTENARATLEMLRNSSPASRNSDALAFLEAWLAFSYPGLATDRSRAPVAPLDVDAGELSAQSQAAALLLAFVTRSPGRPIVAAAQRILTSHRLNCSTVEPLVAAVEGLILAGKLSSAAAWCDALIAESYTRAAPTWQSIFAGLRSEISLHEGDLVGAEHFAMAALNRVPAKNLGVSVGRPLASLICALAAAGRTREAESHLCRDVPRALFESRFGLYYLHARGHVHLACARHHEAIADFSWCGDLMRRWGIDLPGLVPWRNDLAEAYLRMQLRSRARDLAQQHIAVLGRADAHRTGGVSLRLLAAASNPTKRLDLLHEAESTARMYDDKVEVVRLLETLAHAYHSAGDVDRSRALGRRARHLAGQRAGALGHRGSRDDGPALMPKRPQLASQSAPHAHGTLSPAERRVAELAALGERNRDIACKLGITTSTVEQHLTRAYRKLRISRRTELCYILRPVLGVTGRIAV